MEDDVIRQLIRDIIRESLTISIQSHDSYDYGHKTISIDVKLYLDGVEISSEGTYLSE